VLHRPIEILSYVDGKIITNLATSVYKGRTQQLIEITTRAGKKIKITPIHKLLVTDENLNITEKPASQLKTGDYLIAPRHLPVKGTVK